MIRICKKSQPLGKDISSYEKQVMLTIFSMKEECESQDFDLKAIQARVNEDCCPNLKSQIVATLLHRLVKLGYLSFYEKENTTYFKPACEKEEFISIA